jgi:hypothetical protein
MPSKYGFENEGDRVREHQRQKSEIEPIYRRIDSMVFDILTDYLGFVQK